MFPRFWLWAHKPFMKWFPVSPSWESQRSTAGDGGMTGSGQAKCTYLQGTMLNMGGMGRYARIQPYQTIYQMGGHALGPVNMTEIPLIKSGHKHGDQYIQPKLATFKNKHHQVAGTPVALLPDDNRPLQWHLELHVARPHLNSTSMCD